MRFESFHDNLRAPRNAVRSTLADRAPFGGIDSFLDFLAGLSLDQWLAVGARFRDPRVPADASAAAALVDAVLADRRLHFDAWLVRDAVETLVFLASCPLGPSPCRVLRTMADAHTMAERAALAILACAWLAPSDVETLVSPFGAS